MKTCVLRELNWIELMKRFFFWGILLTFIGLLSSCDLDPKSYYWHYWQKIEAKSARINKFEVVALNLSKENRQLKAHISQLKFEIKKLESEKNYLKMQMMRSKKKKKREVASIRSIDPKKDLVKYETYQWTPAQVISIAHREFEQKNYEKSAQFFHTFYMKFPGHKKVDDQFLFEAGLAAYESGDHHEWALDYLSTLTKKYPSSQYYRGAKLWMALTYLQLDKKDMFFETVEEFRKKYRNTEEWKVLSQHYEEIVQKYKRRR